MSQTVDPGITSSIQARSHTFVEIDHEIMSKVILLLPLSQEKLLSVTSESMCTKYWLTPPSHICPGKSVARRTDSLDMTIAVDWYVKPQTNQTKSVTTAAEFQPFGLVVRT